MSCPCGHQTPEEHRERAVEHEYRPTCPRDEAWYYSHRLDSAVGYHGPPVQVASGPTLLADEDVTIRNTRERVPRSGPSGEITGHQGGPRLNPAPTDDPPCL